MDYQVIAVLAAVVVLAIGVVLYKKREKKAPRLDDVLEPGKDDTDREIEKKAEECAKEPDEHKRAEKVKKLAKAAREFPRKKRD
jgi:hypothetical protein